jgi:hypothetical protein
MRIEPNAKQAQHQLQAAENKQREDDDRQQAKQPFAAGRKRGRQNCR